MSDSQKISGLFQAANFAFEGGDVELRVKIDEEKYIGKVCSSSMALASPVWKLFIFPPWNGEGGESVDEKKGRTVTSKPLDFTEDDSDALLILLRIAHLKFGLINSGSVQTPTEMYQIALLCDQYNCNDLVRPWLAEWIKTCQTALDDPENWSEELLFVFWAFGYASQFKSLAVGLVKRTKRDHSGELLSPRGHPLDLDEPTSIIASISVQRLLIIEALLNIPYSLVDRFEAITTEHDKSFCKSSECVSICYGYLLLNLQRMKLWPRKLPEEVTQSVYGLRDFLLKLSIPTERRIIDESRHYFDYDSSTPHSHCAQFRDFRVLVQSVMDNIGNPVLESHRIHMANSRLDF